MTTTRALISTLLAVTVLATAGGGVARPARTGGAAQRMDAPATCPPDVARNSALGVALTLPPRWQEAAPGKYPPGELDLQIPAPPGRPGNDERLNIASWGTTTDRDDARAAAAGMNRLLKGMKAPVSRVPVRYGGAPGVLVRGLPIPPAGVTAIVLAHAGAVYKILAPGKNLAPDQRQALASLRFIPRVGPFPPAVPAAPVVAAPPPPSLLLTVPRTGRSPVLRVRATGSGYRPGEAVELHACWTGSPRPGIRGVRYTWYALFAKAHANRAGSLNAALAIPVSPQAYVSYTLRVLADDARIGSRLATTTIRFSSTGPATSQAANWSISRVSPRASTADARAVRLLSERRLTRNGQARFLAWGPRGHLLLYLDRDALWLSDLSGRTRWEVLGSPLADAAFAADGTHILYRPVATGGLPGAIIRINLHGGDRRRLVGPDYRPVGTSATSSGAVGLAASTLQDGRVALERAGRLFALDPRRDTITSLGAMRLPALPAANSPPSSWTAVAPHGTRVATCTASGELTIRDVQTGRLLRRVVPAGGRPVPGAGLLPTMSVSWSPNDHALVYELGGPGGALKAVDVGTGRGWTLLRVHLETLSGFTWSPDGSMLAFSDVETGTNVGLMSEIELINAGGAGLRTLDPQATRPGWVQAHVPGQTDPLWSPSGRAIGYTRVGSPMNGTSLLRTNVWLADLAMP